MNMLADKHADSQRLRPEGFGTAARIRRHAPRSQLMVPDGQHGGISATQRPRFGLRPVFGSSFHSFSLFWLFAGRTTPLEARLLLSTIGAKSPPRDICPAWLRIPRMPCS